MSQPAIIVEGISKRYRLGHQASPHQTFREMATGILSAPFRKFRSAGEGGREGEEFWALKDINFEVQPGEVVGIIGRNGAGKSTLLKILSRITEPTTGQIRLHGRVASLLEVGTGFHPELTGRENIYLNGAILGMKRAEISKKFDEIVAFAETEKFLDTPVKHYSSGMYVRLAFAVAAHLEPEILIVDEVLAVGDAAFQKKCLGKMKEVSKGGGRTVLFVSHNMAAIESLCTRAVYLETGAVNHVGTASECIEKYLQGGAVKIGLDANGWAQFAGHRNAYGKEIYLERARLVDASGSPMHDIPMGSKLTVEVGVQGLNKKPHAQLGVIVRSVITDDWVAMINTGMNPPLITSLRSNEEIFSLTIPRFPFVPGNYAIDISVALKSIGRIDFVERALEVSVQDSNLYGTGYQPGSKDGVVFLDGDWEVNSAGLDVYDDGKEVTA